VKTSKLVLWITVNHFTVKTFTIGHMYFEIYYLEDIPERSFGEKLTTWQKIKSWSKNVIVDKKSKFRSKNEKLGRQPCQNDAIISKNQNFCLIWKFFGKISTSKKAWKLRKKLKKVSLKPKFVSLKYLNQNF